MELVKSSRSLNRPLVASRALECLGLTMIGDGLLALIEPRRHIALWLRGPEAWEDAMRLFARHPQATRLCGALELAAGLWLASRQAPDGDG